MKSISQLFFKEMKIMLKQISQIHLNSVTVLIGYDISLKGLCVLIYEDPHISNILKQLFNPNTNYERVDYPILIETIVTFQNRYLYLDNYASLFNIEYFYNKERTLLEELTYVSHFTKERLNIPIEVFLEDYFSVMKIKEKYKTKIKNLSMDWKIIFKLLFRLISMPQIMFFDHWNFEDKVLEYVFMKVLMNICIDFKIIIIIGMYDPKNREYDCHSMLEIKDCEIKSITSEYGYYFLEKKDTRLINIVEKWDDFGNKNYERIVYDNKKEQKQLSLQYLNKNNLKEKEALGRRKYDKSAKDSRRSSLSSVNEENIKKICEESSNKTDTLQIYQTYFEPFLTMNDSFNPKEERSSKAKHDYSRKKSKHEQQGKMQFLFENEEEYSDFYEYNPNFSKGDHQNKNYIGFAVKNSKKNIISRIVTTENYKFNLKDVIFIVKQQASNTMYDLSYLVILTIFLITFIVICRRFQYSFNFESPLLFIRSSMSSFYNLFWLSKLQFYSLETFKKTFVFILKTFLYPMFNDIFTFNDFLIQYELHKKQQTVKLFKIYTTLIYAFYTLTLKEIMKKESKKNRKNMHIFYTPMTFFISMYFLLQFFCTLPVLIIALILDIDISLIVLSTASFISIIFTTMRHFGYPVMRTDTWFFIALLVICSFNLSCPTFFEQTGYSIFHFTRKLNPFLITSDFNFLSGRLKIRHLGYGIRIYTWITLFCIYHLSKM